MVYSGHQVPAGLGVGAVHYSGSLNSFRRSRSAAIASPGRGCAGGCGSKNSVVKLSLPRYDGKEVGGESTYCPCKGSRTKPLHRKP